ncbi:MAG: hypothetical protein IT308_09935 [Anaerolineaceae bacterium]|nr:hypothetical protein [Anaerolineaceae bacterium]
MSEEHTAPAGEQVSEAPAVSPVSTVKQPPELVQSLAQITHEVGARDESPPLPGRDLPGGDLERYKDWIAEAYRFFSAASKRDLTLSYASEWVLDNYYIIRQALQQIHEDLPVGYYRQLPKLRSGPLAGFARIYVIARAMLTSQRYLLNPTELESMLCRLQNDVLLTIGELWALPIFLRYGLVEALAFALVGAVQSDDTPDLPARLPCLPGIPDPFAEGEAPLPENANSDLIANMILSLRTVSEQDWNNFTESASRMEDTLRKDPAGVYASMDFKTRNRYRTEIEGLARATGKEEIVLAEAALELASGAGEAQKSAADVPLSAHREVHIGYYLLGKGRAALETHIGYKPRGRVALRRWLYAHAQGVYFAGLALLMILTLFLIALAVQLPVLVRTVIESFTQAAYPAGLHVEMVVVALLLAAAMLIPALTMAASLLNWLVTTQVPPDVLPKLDFEDEIPETFYTLVVIPGMITSYEDSASLVRQLELHYLRNPQPGLSFALLTDFRDADSETLPEDEGLVKDAQRAIDILNARYAPISSGDGRGPARKKISDEDAPRFYLLHRRRLWNSSENKWMGWERKRGKLQELNRFLRGADDLSFITLPPAGTPAERTLRQVRFVLTLDADTILPLGAAGRLAGTLAHPLNRPVFDENTGRVVSGYTVLQPRMEIHPKSANFSWFTRIFAGDAGLDLYSLAVSDAYQDLFGEGIYVGKGIYDVEAFERSVSGHIKENMVLSHDLLEGLLGRAALVTDITMVEDYPQNYLIQALRQRRWMRGDWQLLPWLLRPARHGAAFSAIDRWKIFDNLRRALLAPALLFIFISGSIFLPMQAGVWTGVLMTSLAIPLLTSAARSILQTFGGEIPRSAFHPLLRSFLRWLLAVSFLIYEAYIALDAAITTLYRLMISHRKLLQWTTAAQTTRLFSLHRRRNIAWQKMAAAVLAAGILTLGLELIADIARSSLTPALVYSAGLLVLWALSPLLVWWIHLPLPDEKAPLKEEQRRLLRQVARRTWGFFERFVGPEDHWLPPDHYQETPGGTIAHRTSPTNIGLLFTSTLAAYDLGYLNQLELAARLGSAIDTLAHLERAHGHFLNWYDTLTLQPLSPRYISTVDSGNLAAALIVAAQGCRGMAREPIFRWILWQGYEDALTNLDETLTGMHKAGIAQSVRRISSQIAEMQAEVRTTRQKPGRWYALYLEASGPFWQGLSENLMKLIKEHGAEFDQEMLLRVQEVAAQVSQHHAAVKRTIDELAPWIPLLEELPLYLQDARFSEALANLKAALPYNLSLGKISARVGRANTSILELQNLLKEETPAGSAQPEEEALAKEQIQTVLVWFKALTAALARADRNARALLEKFDTIAMQAERYVNEMDFRYLYNTRRRVFHIGCNLDAGQLDPNFYDLLASEARITSLIAIAKGDVPQLHWLYLSRPVTRVDGRSVLLSWSGTMFEYLMPPLFLRSYPGTLLADSSIGAVKHQIAYGREKGAPWGISESGFYHFDASQNYQYRAFGVPGLGFKRGLGDDLVIAPYASLMALGWQPRAVAANAEELIRRKAFGAYGMYEALDLSPDRLLLDETSAVVNEYMAHHQGMILMAMANYFFDDIMVQRMHADPHIQSVALLLQEQMPLAAPVQEAGDEDVKGVQRVPAEPERVTPWNIPVQTSIPQVHLLSNGSFNTLISNSGGGYNSWRGMDLTRWRADAVLDPWGTWVYIQDVESGTRRRGGLWSAAPQPIPGDAADIQVSFFAHMVVFRRTQRDIVSTMEVTVAPDDPVEIRRIHLNNTGEREHTLRVTSYGEVSLAAHAEDARQPAFNKLFIESEFVPKLSLQIYRRRPRSGEEAPVFLGHMLVAEKPFTHDTVRHEGNRYNFIGRNRTLRNPAGLTGEAYLSGESGATLDPIFALGQEAALSAHETSVLATLTFAGESREEIIALAQRYQNWNLIERTFHQANTAAQTWLGRQDFTAQAFRDALHLLSALLYPLKAVRAAPETLAANQLGQPGLWRFGISGDYPILLVDVEDAKHLDLVREALMVQKFLRNRRFKIDLVLINRQASHYDTELDGMLRRLIARMNSNDWFNQRGGVFILTADQMNAEERTLLETAAGVILRGECGTLGSQLPGYAVPTRHLPALMPVRVPENKARAALPPYAEPLEAIEGLQFYNGYGGFSADGREYIIDLNLPAGNGGGMPGNYNTPAPWVNVIGYPEFGFLVSEAGSQCTWAVNSGENRLTPWSNDPVRDPTGEALYLRDEETGEVWTPTPQPAGGGFPCRVRHGAGFTRFEQHSHGLRQTLTLFASPEDPVKIIHLKVTNTLAYTRRITATQYVDWVLGTQREAGMAFIIPEYDAAQECLLARNPYNAECGERVAFLIASKPVHGLTADRKEFLGFGGNTAFPEALRRLGLEGRVTPGEEACGVLQLHLDLLPGGSEEIYFVLGQGKDKEDALALAKEYHNSARVGAAYTRTHTFWDRLLGTVQVKTPDPAANLILNRWALYQALSCRIWGRSAFYQSSGAFGFRDQLQDVLALLAIDPAITRGQILNAAMRQFEEGDVLHWWHPPSGRGVRTRISDNLVWLPYVTARYVEATGDASILAEQLPFLTAAPLGKEENERYGYYPHTEKTFSLMEHCQRAIEKGATIGAHGLPLIGTGDWNDGLNRVGDQGRGESVWLAWFLCDTLERFATVCERNGQVEAAASYRARAKGYGAAVAKNGWDGAWYRRAYDDDGMPLGSAENMECKIDAIAQSWSVLSGAGDVQRSRRAMGSVLEHLVRIQDRLSLLLSPPFDKTQRNPGYIKGYLPGTRENGGQYTHAAIWTAWAFAQLGDGKQAGVLFDLLNPIYQADTVEKAAVYRVEPYAIAADVYGSPPYVRRGGWTWYTGSAGWLYRLGLEGVLGLRKVGNELEINPVISPEWDGFEIRYRFGETVYAIAVENAEHVTRGVGSIRLDGQEVKGGRIPLVDDGEEHTVRVRLGRGEA